MQNINHSRAEAAKEIKARIRKIHDGNASQRDMLMKQVKQNYPVVRFNILQYLASIATQKVICLEWSRGSGKTTELGRDLSDLAAHLPRSVGAFVGPTYKDILTDIIPSLKQGMEMFGLFENLHYFVRQRPPRTWRGSWVTAWQEPNDYKNFITFFNGMGIHLISHDKSNDGRGLNTDWIRGDEAALLDPKKIQANLNPTFRGTKKEAFEGKKGWGTKKYVSSTPITAEGQWFVDMEELARTDPKDYAFIKGTSAHNKANLRPGYLEEARKEAYAEWLYLAEYHNIRPKFTKNSFYPLLDIDKHGYIPEDNGHYQTVGQARDCRGDADLVQGQPLILGVDWGASINCLTANQHLRSINEYRTLKSMYVLGSDQKIQDDLFNEFHQYYKYHDNKLLIIFYDNTGNVRTGHTRLTRAQQMKAQLIKLGWTVQLMTVGGTNAAHELKHMVWNAMCGDSIERMPDYRFNKRNCKELYLSMKNAKAKPDSKGGIHKDKGSERSEKIQRQHATDLSDANDTPVIGLFRKLLRGGIGTALPGMTTRNR